MREMEVIMVMIMIVRNLLGPQPRQRYEEQPKNKDPSRTSGAQRRTEKARVGHIWSPMVCRMPGECRTAVSVDSDAETLWRTSREREEVVVGCELRLVSGWHRIEYCGWWKECNFN